MAGGPDPTGLVQVASQAIVGRVVTASKNWLRYIQRYDENIQKTKTLHRTLENQRQEIAHRVKLGKMQNEEVVAEVNEWLQDLNRFLGPDKSWDKLLVNEDVRKEAEKCCFGCCRSPKYRHDLSKLAEEKAKEIEERIGKMRARGTAPVTLPPVEPPKIGSFGTYYCPGLKSRDEKLDQILKLLKDDKVNRIGIYGMGGAGKTTLMLELARRVEKENVFNEIVMAEVSQFPDIRRIQDQIADRIHLSLDRYHSIEERAINLGKRLKQIKLVGNKLQGHEEPNPPSERNQGEEKQGQTPRGQVEAPENKGKNEMKIVENALNERPTKEERSNANDEKEVPVEGRRSDVGPRQRPLEKGGKLLVIFDNMWRKLDLHLVGIPYELEKDLGCKIIITSRSEDVCKVMDVAPSNIFKVGDLSDEEAKHLFLQRVGVIADSNDYKPILEKLLKKCSRLPLSINILADTLKNQTLSVWEHILAQLEKPIPGETIGVLDDTYSIIEMSYNYLGKEDKKMFFLLCSLFPPGSSVCIVDLLRYGIGLGLFEYANSIDEAVNQAYKWANELKTLSLLSEVDYDKGEIHVHDDVREAAKSFAAKGGYVFHVGAIPRWLKQESYEKFVAISLTSNDNYEYLAGRDLPKLRLLRSLGTFSTKLHENYFSRMKNLEVLDLSRSNIEVLPPSIADLKNLETLLLEHCSLSNILPICKLLKLQVLSLKDSTIGKLPKEFKDLEQLKLLDLTNCSQLNYIPINVLRNLTHLEGLYMRNSFSNWGLEEGMASLSELNSMSLHVLEINIRSVSQLPDGDFPALVLSSYKIDFVVSSVLEDTMYKRSLQVGDLHAHDIIKECWKPLVQNSESLYLEKIHGLKNVAPYLGEYGLRELKRLKVSKCSGMECLISGRTVYQLLVFPQLERLYLESLPDLQTICHGNSPPDLFSNLKELILSSLGGLQTFALPIKHATNLRVMEVKSCNKLEYIFSASGDIGLPALQKLLLQNLRKLRALCGETSDGNEEGQHLITKKMVFPSLEELKIDGLSEVAELWDMAKGEEFARTFPKLRSISIKYMPKLKHVWSSEYCKGSFIFTNLKELKVRGCYSMETICPPPVARGFQSLELLRVQFCGVKKIISTEGEDDGNLITDSTMTFTKLLKLELLYLGSLIYFYKGSMKIELPALKSMKLDSLDCMERWVEVDCSSHEVDQEREDATDEPVLFNGKVQFPSLEQMFLDSVDKIKGLWEFTSAQDLCSTFPCLQLLSLRWMFNLQRVWMKELNVGDSHNFLNLKDIDIYYCSSLKSLFQTSAADKSKLTTVIFPALQTLKVDMCGSFKYILEGNVHLQFPALKYMKLRYLEALKTFANLEDMEVARDGEAENPQGDDLPLALLNRKILFPSLEELHLLSMEAVNKLWNVTTCEAFTFTFPNLRTVSIENLPKLRHAWSDDFIEGCLYIESLENMMIGNCDELESLFAPTTSNSTSTQELHSRQVISFPKLQKLKLYNLKKFKCLYEGSTTMDFQTLKKLVLKDLPLIKVLVKVDNGSSEAQEKEKDADPKENFTEQISENPKENFTEQISKKEPIKPNDDGPVLFKGHVEFPSLKELKIAQLPALENIYETKEEDTAATDDIFPTLRTMHLTGGDVTQLKQIPRSILHQLSSLQIRKYHRLKCLVSTNASTDGALLTSFSGYEKLEQLIIEDCADMEVIVSEELQKDNNEIIYPRLKEVKLSGMVSLSAFSSGNYTLQLPVLASLDISGCDMIRSFSLGPAVTPNLSKLEMDGKTIAKDGDLNTTLQSYFDSTKKAEKYWPRTVLSKLHEQHRLRLVNFRYYRCNGCSKRGRKYSYFCSPCDFDLHPTCALTEDQLIDEPDEMKVAKTWPRILKHDLHESHELKLQAGRNYSCDGCSQMGELFSYYCSECDFDLHPKCALKDGQMTGDSIQENEQGNTDLTDGQPDKEDTTK